jgi:tetratricopeptide (TPR) repeat protein
MLALLVLLLTLPRLIGCGLTNAGNRVVVRGILLGDGPAEQRVRELRQAQVRFRQALALNGNSVAARWGLARACLALGRVGVQEEVNHATAAAVLRLLVSDNTRNPIIYQDALLAFLSADRSQDVIKLYEANPPLQQTQLMSDTVACAYLQRGAPDDVARAYALRPGDLYANYHLWHMAQDASDVEAATVFSDTLVYFPLEAVHPTNERLLDYAAEVIPFLLEEGLWDRERTLNVVSFLVWQHSGASGVERLLEQLIRRYPAEPDWPFYLAEFYHRRGDLGRAEVAYRQVLEVDPGYTQSYLRLGVVAETKSQRRLEEAASWYCRYYKVAPQDLLGLKRLAAVCAALEEAGVENEHCRKAASQVDAEPETIASAVLQEALTAYTDDRGIVAELLGVPVTDVELGPNLVENSGFEVIRKKPEGWKWSDMFNREPFNAAAFAGGGEELLSFEGQQVIRVDGFWVRRQEDRSLARAGFGQRSEVVLAENLPYLFSLYYRTLRVPDGKASAWVSGDPKVLWALDHGVVATNGAWRRFVAIGWNRSGAEAAIHPLVRSFAAGSVEFDDVQIRLIRLPETTAVEIDEARFRVIGQDD